MDIRAILGAVLLVSCAPAPPAERPQAFNCTRISELGNLELAPECGEMRRGEPQSAESHSTVVAETPRAKLEEMRAPITEVSAPRIRTPAPRPEPFRRPVRPPPPPR
jgi:hypothetical protein